VVARLQVGFGLGWAELDWTGLGWAGLGWAGLGQSRLCTLSLNPAHPRRTRPRGKPRKSPPSPPGIAHPPSPYRARRRWRSASG
jgi:hypothetical protein